MANSVFLGSFGLFSASGTSEIFSGSVLAFGGTTASFPGLRRSGATLQAVLADESALANFTAAIVSGTFASFTSGYQLVNSFILATAPTVASGFGVGASVVAHNGTAAFTVNVGTGGTASDGVITMPAAVTGWIAHVENRTGTLGNYANQRTVQIASTTTSITVENQTISTGAALAWTASDVLVVTAMAY